MNKLLKYATQVTVTPEDIGDGRAQAEYVTLSVRAGVVKGRKDFRHDRKYTMPTDTLQ